MKLPLAAIWKKYKLVLLVAAVGVVLSISRTCEPVLRS